MECAGPNGMDVALDGSGSSDADGDALTYTWSEDGIDLGTGKILTVNLGLGEHIITLTVDDGNGGTASDEVVINVVDTTPPTIDVTVEATNLWPPDGKMTLVASGISATDVCCDAKVDVSVASSAADDDGDIEIVDNGDGTYDVSVRAKRAGKGGDRTYTITLTATDCADNQAIEVVEVTVSHD